MIYVSNLKTDNFPASVDSFAFAHLLYVRSTGQLSTQFVYRGVTYKFPLARMLGSTSLDPPLPLRCPSAWFCIKYNTSLSRWNWPLSLWIYRGVQLQDFLLPALRSIRCGREVFSEHIAQMDHRWNYQSFPPWLSQTSRRPPVVWCCGIQRKSKLKI